MTLALASSQLMMSIETTDLVAWVSIMHVLNDRAFASTLNSQAHLPDVSAIGFEPRCRQVTPRIILLKATIHYGLIWFRNNKERIKRQLVKACYWYCRWSCGLYGHHRLDAPIADP